MSHTLLLRLAGPLQSWGTQSRFDHRDTGLEPSKSGVIGLVCAALGRERSDPVDDLAQLRMGVRVDWPGVLLRDYHTAGGAHHRGDPYGRYGVVKADGSRGDTVVSERFYLVDAEFLVGLEGEDLDLLQRIDAALRRPRWPLFLGRKACVPGVPVYLPDGGIRRDTPLEHALRQHPWRPLIAEASPYSRREPPRDLRCVLETDHARGEAVRLDQPAGPFGQRRYRPRYVRTEFVPPP